MQIFGEKDSLNELTLFQLFLTKMDKAYNIKCMYREVERTVEAALDVRFVVGRRRADR